MSNDSNRRFSAGDEFIIHGLPYRVVPGVKQRNGASDDLRLEWKIADAWQPTPMVHVLFQTDFFCDNEEALYPRSKGFQGGNFFLRALSKAKHWGWTAAANELERQKNARRGKEAC